MRAAASSIITVTCGLAMVIGMSAVAAATPAAASRPATSASTTAPAARAAAPAVNPRRDKLLAVPHAVRLPAGEQSVCPTPTLPGQMECQAILLARAGQQASPHATSRQSAAPAAAAARFTGYTPSELRAAYNLASASASKGKNETVAIVDAYTDPRAAADLASYRRHFGLPACSTSSHCLRIVNEAGKPSPLPKANAGWSIEQSVDLDMVSAICPRCHIVLVEAASASITDFSVAEDTATRLGARFVSNSWSGPEFIGQDAFNPFFNHPGDAIVFASGDAGYGTGYPTDTQYVTAVGGTTLSSRSSGRRHWAETVWGASTSAEGTGSGCSALEAKPSWQQKTDNSSTTGCLNRIQNDVAADANPSTGAAIYDSYAHAGGWRVVGGTSVATPLITAAYALAGYPDRGTYPAAYPYQHSTSFYDVTSGANGICESNRQYLCHGKRGYDGPTGLGTPDGTGGFSNRGAQRVTLVDPGTQDLWAGASVSLPIDGLDTNGKATTLDWNAVGLPGGLAVSAAAGDDGVITGTLPSAPGSYQVTVTAQDPRTHASGSTSFVLATVAQPNPVEGIVYLDIDGGALVNDCLSVTSDASGTPVEVQPDECAPTLADGYTWRFVPGNSIGSGEMVDGYLPEGSDVLQCITPASDTIGAATALAPCAEAPDQDWQLDGGVLANVGSGLCLTYPSSTSSNSALPAELARCQGSSNQAWALPAGNLSSGVPGLCLDGSADSPGQPTDVAACAATNAQTVSEHPAGMLSVANGWCLTATGNGLDGAAVDLEDCPFPFGTPPVSDQVWLQGPGGELINAYTGKCLADPGNDATSGTALTQEDCYGEPGEVWING